MEEKEEEKIFELEFSLDISILWVADSRCELTLNIFFAQNSIEYNSFWEVTLNSFGNFVRNEWAFSLAEHFRLGIAKKISE